MHSKFLENLQNYDLHSLLQTDSQWEELCWVERYWKLNSHLILGELDGLKELIKAHEKDLGHFQLKSLFQMLLNYEIQNDHSRELFQVLRGQDSFGDYPYIAADVYFNLGLFFLRENNGRLAELYFQESTEIYKQLNLKSFVWKGLLNILLAKSIDGHFDDFEKGFKKLMDDWPDLSHRTQYFFGRFLVWIYLFLADVQPARNLISNLLRIEFELSDSTSGVLQKYELYLNLVHCGEDFRSYRGQMESVFKKQVFLVKKERSLTLRIAKDYVDNWTQKFNVADRFMLIDILMHHMWELGELKLLMSFFQWIESRSLPTEGMIIYPNSLYALPLLAAESLNHPIVAKRWQISMYKSASPRQLRALEQKRQGVYSTAIENRISIDVLNRNVQIGNEEFDFDGKEKSFSAVLELANGKENVSMLELYKKVYGKSYRIEYRPQLSTLLARVKRYLKRGDLFKIKEEWVVKNKNYSWTVTGIKQRRMQVKTLRILKALKNFKSGVSSEVLAEELSLSKRTLNFHLKILVENGNVHREGNTHHSKYFLK